MDAVSLCYFRTRRVLLLLLLSSSGPSITSERKYHFCRRVKIKCQPLQCISTLSNSLTRQRSILLTPISREEKHTHSKAGESGIKNLLVFFVFDSYALQSRRQGIPITLKQFSSTVFHYPDTTEMSWNGLMELQEFAWKLRQQFCLASAGLAF